MMTIESELKRVRRHYDMIKYRHEYYLANKDKANAASMAYRKAHPDRSLEHKKYSESHKEQISAWHKADREANRQKYRDRQKKWRQENPEKAGAKDRRERLKAKYSMTTADWNALFERQGCKCGICGSTDPGGKYGWHVDHDHATDKVRGILCNGCNLMIGHAKDDTDRMRSGITYLLTGGVSSHH